ncbi:tRNA modification GTPase TrmE [Candidatus Liberibacter solanacearum]|uniref:tRNA modification GTPase MnmE n=1 Tax=Candidatus Liberibacter solanacearum TaxID=556287 RepID=A0A094Z2P3_9HYPH|nr:tRNA uridine-5-carboxymethylaminomethyl(34) synthesis GTPase MnmE [Candidatus Liberibacter solanacearum]KGB27917.1 tRNA modification GTPase TrmE [Candidatus Liberibacter solanacearum]KJZ80980.1 tRNA modification GTPase TrmE [Candidatus Liberibacter solanacearum]KJZ82154.1 GTPase and tRNA-U34 5-formylation enzyme TrmE [Candidatus Liberibacter solanacearum]KQC49439.1 tRNA modification GTPase TrmE [Candidatus Liberibacter solanacearum]
MNYEKKTIFALSSGIPPSAISVIRLSGSSCFQVCEFICKKKNPLPRVASLRFFYDFDGRILDKGLLILFPSPKSFTGEDCAEFHVHGGISVVDGILEELAKMPNLRRANPGEFSRRAFENGKIDLLEAESLADLISSETEMQRRLSMEGMSGKLSNLYNGWINKLTYVRSFIEADLDFSDEEDVQKFSSKEIWNDILLLKDEISSHISQGKLGEIIRNGYKIVILGNSNAGKSSLLNALAKRDVAIVTDVPGTTRDVITIDLDLGGYLVKISDTAGIRETNSIVEKEGIKRTFREVENADLILFLEEISSKTEISFPKNISFIFIGTKSDLYDNSFKKYDHLISSVTGEGLEELINKIKNIISNKFKTNSMFIPSHKRHLDHLSQAVKYLEDASSGEKDCGLDIIAENLRLASISLGRITGHVDVEQLLDIIFSKFCIGK